MVIFMLETPYRTCLPNLRLLPMFQLKMKGGRADKLT
jgi:hypothetical protein